MQTRRWEQVRTLFLLKRTAGRCKAAAAGMRNTSRSSAPNEAFPVDGRRYAGYSVQPVSAGGEEVCRKAALNGSGTACFTPSRNKGGRFILPSEHSFHHPSDGPPPSGGRLQTNLLGREILCLTRSFSGSLLRELAAEGRLKECPARRRTILLYRRIPLCLSTFFTS